MEKLLANSELIRCINVVTLRAQYSDGSREEYTFLREHAEEVTTLADAIRCVEEFEAARQDERFEVTYVSSVRLGAGTPRYYLMQAQKSAVWAHLYTSEQVEAYKLGVDSVSTGRAPQFVLHPSATAEMRACYRLGRARAAL